MRQITILFDINAFGPPITDIDIFGTIRVRILFIKFMFCSTNFQIFQCNIFCINHDNGIFLCRIVPDNGTVFSYDKDFSINNKMFPVDSRFYNYLFTCCLHQSITNFFKIARTITSNNRPIGLCQCILLIKEVAFAFIANITRFRQLLFYNPIPCIFIKHRNFRRFLFPNIFSATGTLGSYINLFQCFLAFKKVLFAFVTYISRLR